LLEVVEDEEALTEVKKGLEMMKKGMEKGMKKGMDCGCKKCGKYMSEGKKHHMKNHKPDCKCPMCSGEKKCGKMMGKKMNEADQAWWDSVNGMLGSDINQKNWDGGWSEVGEVQQAVREGVDEGVMDAAGQMVGGAARAVASMPGKVAGAVGGAFQAADHAAGAAVHDFSQGFRKKFGMQHEADPKDVESYEKMIKTFGELCMYGRGKTDQAEDYMDGFLDTWASRLKKTPAWPELLEKVVEVAKKYDYLGLLSQKAREHGVQLPA
jgi:hypothetical protein